MLDYKKDSKLALLILKNLNFLILLYVTCVISYCLKGIIHESSGLSFINKITNLPLAYWKFPIIIISLYISELFLMSLNKLNMFQNIIRLCFEIIITFLIVYLIGFSYTGIILLVLAVSIDFIPKFKWRVPLLIGFCLIYLVSEYIILSLNSEIITFNVFIEYFQNDTRLILTGILNILSSLNLLIFLIYIILVVRSEYDEKEYILSLNEKLNNANEELQEANTQLEEYSKEIVKMTETRERNRLAREIHDTLGHTLTGIITGLEACTALIDVAPEATKIQLKSIIEVASQGMTDVRRSVSALRPDRLDKFDLKKAIIKMVSEMRDVTNADINLEINSELKNFSNEEEDVIFRIIQESITNSIRHGKADQINIVIDTQNNYLQINIKDNGIGCKKIEKGFGLHHMQERLNLLKGQLYFNGDNGFLVNAKVPIRMAEADT